MSTAWFSIYYPLIGAVLLWLSYSFLITPQRVTNYFIKTAELNGRPRLILRWLRYFLMTSIASAIFAAWPFALNEFLFSIGCLILVFVFGRLLLMWDEVKGVLPEKRDALERMARKSGILMFALAVISFLLWYLLITG